jgi:hypothetical protein
MMPQAITFANSPIAIVFFGLGTGNFIVGCSNV